MAEISTADEFDFDFELRSTVGHLIRVSQQVHYSLWSHKVSELRLTSPQFAVLHVLAHESPLDQRTIGLRSSLDRSTVADIVSRLTERGLLECSDDPDDGRRKRIILSMFGYQVHQSAAISALEINESLLSQISAADRMSLLRILNQIVQHHENRANSQ